MGQSFVFNPFTSNFDVVNTVSVGSPANGLSITTAQVLSLGLSSASTTGALSSTDWSTFNGKQDTGLCLLLTGGTMQGAINMGGFKITNLLNGSSSQDAVNFGQLSLYIPLTQKGANNGVATLDSGGKVPVSQLPSSVFTYEGTWNANTNTPTLVDGTGDAGMVYIVSVAGTTNFGSGPITFAVGDWAVYDGSVWQKSLNSNAVSSVNGQTGAVTVNAINQLTGDATAGPASGSQSVALTLATVNAGVGSFGTATSVPSITVNAKGLITAATSTSIQIAESQVTNLVSDLAGKQPTGNYITALTGDATASGPGSAALTLATVNSNVGTFGTATAVSTVTVNAKGLVTAASSTAIQITESQVTNLTTDLAAKVSDSLYLAKGSILAATAASTPANVAVGTNGQVLMANSLQSTGVAWTSVAPGAKNYIANPNFEFNTVAGWSLSHSTIDATTKVPNQATGSWTSASGNLSISAITGGGQLAGTYSLGLVSSAATTVGDMLISDVFTIDLEDQAKQMTIKFYYQAITNVANGNYSGTSANSFSVQVYDVNNGIWIQPAGTYGMTQMTGVGFCTATFQTAANGTGYRLAISNANATAGAVTLYFDDFYVGPQTAPLGAAITDWQAYTLTIGGTTTPPTQGAGATKNAQWRRVGSDMEIMFNYQQTAAGTAGSGTYTFPMPAGFNIDYSKLSSAAYPAGPILGYAKLSAAAGSTGSTTPMAHVLPLSGSNSFFLAYAQTAIESTAAVGSAAYPLSGTTQSYSFFARVPISGWSSNVQMSSDTATNVVAAHADRNGTNQTGINTNNSYVQLAFNSTSSAFGFDTNGAFNTSTFNYVAPVSGYYRVSATATLNSTNVLASSYVLAVRVNSSSVNELDGPWMTPGAGVSFALGVGGTVKLNAGDTVGVYLYGAGNNSASTLTVNGNQSSSYFTIERIAGPATIAAVDTVAARYSDASGAAIGTSAAVYKFVTSTFDTTGSYSSATGLYTVPISGKYQVAGSIVTASVNLSATQGVNLFVYKNGSLYSQIGQTFGNGNANSYRVGGVDSVSCVAGDTLAIFVTSSVATTAITTATSNYADFYRQGN